MLALAALLALPSPSPIAPSDPPSMQGTLDSPSFRAPAPPDGDPSLGAFRLWRPACSGTARMDARELERIARRHDVLLRAPTTVIDTTPASRLGASFDLVFVVSGSPPAGATAALATAESVLESYFDDPVTVTIDVSFQSLPAGILGATAPVILASAWSGVRKKLVDGRDGDDVIQMYLPPKAGFRVNFNQITLVPVVFPLFWKRVIFSGSAPPVTSVAFTKANGRAIGFVLGGNDASMILSSTFPFDFDPSDGVDPGEYSFQDVVVHEVAHALGFFSAGDRGVPISTVMTLDLYRFKATDSHPILDNDPDNYVEFHTYPQLLAFNLPDDDVASDLITVEYRMSDGLPYQMSHFREQVPNIGLMDPTIAAGETFYPAFLKTPDLAMLDAIGWDR
jgi:hypothetical protein